MKWIGVIGVFVIVVLGLSLLFSNFFPAASPGSMMKRMVNTVERTDDPTPIVQLPFDAYFAIYTNGTLRTFDTAMYKEQSEDVYIPQDESRTVRVNANGVTWRDFFDTLPFSLDHACLTTGTGQIFCDGEGGNLVFVLNGEAENNALSLPIQKGDELLVSFGPDPNRIGQELSVFETR